MQKVNFGLADTLRRQSVGDRCPDAFANSFLIFSSVAVIEVQYHSYPVGYSWVQLAL